MVFTSTDIIEKLAPAVHESWRAIARREKWPIAYDMAYDQLPPGIKSSNEAAARRIPDVLAIISLAIVPGDATEAEDGKIRALLEKHLELLAEQEHLGWVEHLLEQGWRYSPDRDDAKRLHNCLRPYYDLRGLDREKDRDSVRHYPDVVRRAGYKIVST